jgi:FMN phosphatase YigB (HAD superfamily)
MRTAWINRNGNAWPEDLPQPDAIVTSIIELQQLLQPAVRSIKQAS